MTMANINVKASVKIEADSFKSFMKQLKVGTANMKPPFKEYGQYIEKETRQQFVGEVDPDGNKWKALKPATIKRKKTPYKLRETYKMSKSFYAIAEKDSLKYGLSDPKYKYHHYGVPANNLPARVVIGDTNERRAVLNKMIVKYLKLLRAGRK